MNKETIIDFSLLGGPLYAGRDRGVEARKRLNLDDIDSVEDVHVEVRVPERTYSVTSSFFLGLFGDSIRSCGEVNSFFHKFRFKAPEQMLEKFTGYARRALREKKPLILQ